MSNSNPKYWKVKVTELDKKTILESPKSLKAFIPVDGPASTKPKTEKPQPPTIIKRFNGRELIPLRDDAQVFGGDDRRILTSTAYPWRCIGRLSNRCTAALVGEDLLLTAAHCIPWRDLDKGIWNLRFTAGYDSGGSLLGNTERYTAKIIELLHYDGAGDGEVAGYDMIVCRLDKKLGSRLGYFGAQHLSRRKLKRRSYNFVGYPTDAGNGERPAYETGISVLGIDRDRFDTRELETRVDVAPGSSGGPLFYFKGKSPRIVGTYSGLETDGPFWNRHRRSVFAGGIGLINLIRVGRNLE